jgi:chromosome segregation ATPase
VRSTFDRADNTARLALELAEAKREIERLQAEVESRGEQICSLVDRKAVLRDEVERLREALEYLRKAFNAVDAERVTAEAKVARVEARVRTGLGKLDRLTECIEDECDGETVASICHEHDRTGEGECALVADLKAIRAALADAPAEQRAEGGA